MGNLKPYQPGTSGNKKGRPKTKDIREAINETLGTPDKDFGTILKAIINSLVVSALNGNIRAAELLFNYAYGKPKEEIPEEMKWTVITPKPIASDFE
jgi:hypothetical protein